MPIDLPILVVHESRDVMDAIADALAGSGLPIRVAADWTGALTVFEAEHPWLVVTDLSVGSAAAEAFAEAVEFRGAIKLFCMTHPASDPREISKAVHVGVTELFEYPRDLSELVATADGLCSREQRPMSQIPSDQPVTLEGVRVQARLEQRRRLAEALRQHEGNISRVAKRMGCSRQTVYDRMKRLGLKKEDYFARAHVDSMARPWKTTSSDISVLVVEDQGARRNEIAACLSEVGFRVRTAQDCQEAWRILQRSTFDCIVTDFKTPRMSGLDLIEHVRESGSRVPIILLTAYQETPLTVAAMKRGAQSVFNYNQNLSWSDLIREISDQVANCRRRAEMMLASEAE